MATQGDSSQHQYVFKTAPSMCIQNSAREKGGALCVTFEWHFRRLEITMYDELSLEISTTIKQETLESFVYFPKAIQKSTSVAKRIIEIPKANKTI